MSWWAEHVETSDDCKLFERAVTGIGQGTQQDWHACCHYGGSQVNFGPLNSHANEWLWSSHAVRAPPPHGAVEACAVLVDGL